MTTIYKNDDTGAFGGNFITIKLKGEIPEGYEISKAEIKIGNLPIVKIPNPVFPISLNLNQAQTRQLQQQNTIYMKVYDMDGRGITCKGKANFVAKDQVV